MICYFVCMYMVDGTCYCIITHTRKWCIVPQVLQKGSSGVHQKVCSNPPLIFCCLQQLLLLYMLYVKLRLYVSLYPQSLQLAIEYLFESACCDLYIYIYMYICKLHRSIAKHLHPIYNRLLILSANIQLFYISIMVPSLRIFCNVLKLCLYI